MFKVERLIWATLLILSLTGVVIVSLLYLNERRMNNYEIVSRAILANDVLSYIESGEIEEAKGMVRISASAYTKSVLADPDRYIEYSEGYYERLASAADGNFPELANKLRNYQQEQ